MMEPKARLARLLVPENILLGVAASSKKRVLEQVSEFFASRLDLDRATVLEALAARERLGSTALGQGVAIPHARLAGVEHTCAVYVRLQDAIAFAAPDGKPVSEFLVLLMPERAGLSHLFLLAEIAHLFSDREFRNRLDEARTAEAVRDVFAASSAEARAPQHA
jgi:PTS system nitrogen regulatory IIA component